MNSCRNCKEPVNWNYCPKCGQPVQLKRIDRHYIIQEIASAFNAEKGLLYTVKRVFISPGDSVRQYITEDRCRFVKPVMFVIITSLIYTLVSQLFHIDARDFQTLQYDTGDLSGGTGQIELPTANLFINWMINYHGYSSIISGFFVAFWVKLFFRKSGYNLFEIFVLMCFISGISALLFSVGFIFQGLTHLNSVRIITSTAMIYSVWAIGQFFDKKKAASYIKAFISYMLGLLIFGILVVFVAIFIDIIIKH